MVWGAAGLILGLGRAWEQGGRLSLCESLPPHTPPGWAGLWPPHLSTRSTVVMEKGGQAETPRGGEPQAFRKWWPEPLPHLSSPQGSEVM